MNEIVFNYYNSAPLSGLTNNVNTDIPGTVVLLEEGEYKINFQCNMQILSASNTNAAHSFGLYLFQDSSLVNSSWNYRNGTAVNTNIRAQCSGVSIIKLSSQATIKLVANIYGSGTITSRDLLDTSLTIERVS